MLTSSNKSLFSKFQDHSSRINLKKHSSTHGNGSSQPKGGSSGAVLRGRGKCRGGRRSRGGRWSRGGGRDGGGNRGWELHGPRGRARGIDRGWVERGKYVRNQNRIREGSDNSTWAGHDRRNASNLILIFNSGKTPILDEISEGDRLIINLEGQYTAAKGGGSGGVRG